MRRSISVMLVGVIIATALVGITAGPMSAQADPRPEIRVRLWFTKPGGIYDPARWRYTADWFIYPNLFNWLVRWKPGTGGNELEPDLAERWTVSDDGLTYTFFLRKGVQFHKDFGEMTSEDVLHTFKRQADDPKMSFNYVMQRVARIEAPDKYTFRLVLKERDASFMAASLAYRVGMIVSKKAVERFGDDFAKNPVGTGPYVWERFTGGREVVLTANDQYFRGRPAVRRLIFTEIPDEVVAAAAVVKGEFHIVWVSGSPEAVKVLEQAQAQGVRSERVPRYDSLRHVQLSPTFKPTQDVRVRRALSHAVNRQHIAAAMPGLELATDVVRSPKLFGGNIDVPRYIYAPEKARRLLAEAGYPNGFRVRIMHSSEPYSENLATIVQAGWRAVGIDAVLDPAESNLLTDRRNRYNFDAMITSVGRPADPDLFYNDLFFSGAKPPGGWNTIGYTGVDELILAGRREQNRARRQRIYEEIHRKVMTDLPVIPLSFQVFVAAWRPPVTGMINGTANEFWGETIKVRP